MSSPADSSDTNRRSISSTPRLTPEEIRNRAFKGAMRGISEAEVRNFLHRIADELAAYRDRERDLQSTISGLEERIRNPAPVTEEQLIDSLGEETARVLRTARGSATEIVAKADTRASETLTESQATAQRVRDEADRLAREQRAESDKYATQTREEADVNASDLNRQSEQDAQQIRERAEAGAEATVEDARDRGRDMVNEAKAVRERVLTDLARRRSELQTQLEELRAGRDRLVESYEVVRRTLTEAAQALGGTAGDEILDGDLSALAMPDPEAEIEPFVTAESAEPPSAPAPTPRSADAPEPPPEATGEPTPDAAAIPKGSGLRRYVKGALGFGPDGKPLTGDEVEDEINLDIDLAVEDEESADAATTRRDAGAVFAALREERQGSGADDEIEIDIEIMDADAHESDGDGEPLGGDAALLGERDEALAPIETRLGRALKRVVQDDQNELLDALRRSKRRSDPSQLLPASDALVATWSESTRPALDEAYAAGSASSGALDDEAVAALTAVVINPLHERLVDAFGDTTDREELATRLGSRFREWRSSDLDTSIREVLATAFSRGVFDAAPVGVRLRWIPARPGRCSDCDDNALEAVERAKPFPTGHESPPAHRGCRCLLVLD